MNALATSSDTAPETTGSMVSAKPVTPYITRQYVPRCGRCLGQLCLALPSLTAGAPAQRWPVGTVPVTAEPGATSARLPTRAPGNSMLRVPTTACAPTLTGPISRRSPSSQ